MSRLERIGKGVVIAAVGMFGINLLPHCKPSIPKKLYQLEDAKVPEELEQHVKRIADAMGVTPAGNILVFIDKGFSAVSGGHTSLPNGAIVGLPRTFLFETPGDVTAAQVTLQGNAIDWDSEAGKVIQDALVPSGKHINFVIAHELAHIRSKDYLLLCSLSPVTLLVSYIAARTLPKVLFPRYALPAVPAIFVVCLLAYFQVKSSIGRWLEFRADKMAAQSHPSYQQGGIEYMEKNILLQSLLDHRNPSSLNPLSSKHPTFEERLQRLQEMGSISK